ncbi:MAG: helix-turn-helix transcriptional regulator [Deltaproteobacteria bacterium]|nr:helix-turn-helix transcriptional regulator [Deltaproteobacteria bacterium]
MDSREFAAYRKRLGKTQKQLAQLCGTSLKAIQGYEQGWRAVPSHIERQLLFLVATVEGKQVELRPCWDIRACPPDRKQKCPAWEFGAGELCWFINGTICEGKVHKDWREKMKICRTCEVFAALGFASEKDGSCE